MANNRRKTRRKTEPSRRMSFISQHLAMTTDWCDVGKVTRIDVLPDEALLEIFDFYIKTSSPRRDSKWRVEPWQPLVHVCRRWRSVVLGSTRRLNMRLVCSPKTSSRDTLDLWPALPLVIDGYVSLYHVSTDNVIEVLGQSNRVCKVVLYLGGRQLEQVLAAMQVPFPELTHLQLMSSGQMLPVAPDSFLDGSAPRLRIFRLDGIPFPGLPNLLLTATHLVSLSLENIPHSGYFSPEAIVALISVLSNLEKLTLQFQSPQSHPDLETRPLPPSKLYVIPALKSLHFKGVIEYLEDLVTFNDTPQLDEIRITFFNQIDFHTPQLARFINRTPKLTKHGAHVVFYDNYAHVALRPLPGTLEIATSCKEPDWQLSFIEQVCNSSLYPLSTVEDLYIEHRYNKAWKNDSVENSQWLQLLLPFTAVKNLFLSKEFAPGIAAALQELVGGGVTQVLPGLQTIFVKGLEPWGASYKRILKFVAARRKSGHPISIAIWDENL